MVLETEEDREEEAEDVDVSKIKITETREFELSRIDPFNTFSDRYEQWFSKNELAYKSELLAIQNYVPKENLGIEIGSGSAKFAAPLGIRIGVEPSYEMRLLSKKEIECLVDSIGERLPFRNSVFDYVLLVTTICFLDDIKQSFKEIYNILKPKGSLIIGFIDRNSALGKKYEKHKQSNVFYKFAEFYSVEEVIGFLKYARFSKFRFSQTIFHSLSEMEEIEPVKEGYGHGSFVVIEALK